MFLFQEFSLFGRVFSYDYIKQTMKTEGEQHPLLYNP